MPVTVPAHDRGMEGNVRVRQKAGQEPAQIRSDQFDSGVLDLQGSSTKRVRVRPADHGEHREIRQVSRCAEGASCSDRQPA